MKNFTTCDFIASVMGFMYCGQITEKQAMDILGKHCDSIDLASEMIDNFDRRSEGAYKQADNDDLLIKEFNEFLEENGYNFKVKKG